MRLAELSLFDPRTGGPTGEVPNADHDAVVTAVVSAWDNRWQRRTPRVRADRPDALAGAMTDHLEALVEHEHIGTDTPADDA